MSCCKKCNQNKPVYAGGLAPYLDSNYKGWCRDCMMTALKNDQTDWLKDQYRAVFG